MSPPEPLGRHPRTWPGRGAGVLLVHGLGGGPYELEWLGAHLHRRLGVTVRAMVLAGHEAPRALMPPSTHDAWLASVAAQADALARAGAHPVHLVGFSTGAMVALRLAQLGAVTGAVALLAPLVRVYRPRFLPVRPETLVALTPFLGQVPRRPPPLRDRAVRAEVHQLLPFSTLSLAAVRSALALAGLVMGALPRVKVPTLTVQGTGDTVVDPSGAALLHAGLTGRHRLRLVEDSDHLLCLDRARAEVFSEVEAFLTSTTPRSTAAAYPPPGASSPPASPAR